MQTMRNSECGKRNKEKRTVKQQLQKENWMSPNILCPFYVGIVGGRVMQCEGWEKRQRGQYVQVKTGSGEALKKYAERYCGGDYRSCGIYRMICREKYGE